MADDSTDPIFDREKLMDVAADRVGTDRVRRQVTPGAIPTPELVRSMREMEVAAKEMYEGDEKGVNRDYAAGIWTAMAAIRFDFSIEDSRYVNTDTADDTSDQ